MLGEKAKQAVALLSLSFLLLQDKAKTTDTIRIKEEHYPFVALGPLLSPGPYFYLYAFKEPRALSQNCWMVYMTLVMLPYTFFQYTPVDRAPWEWKYGYISLLSV